MVSACQTLPASRRGPRLLWLGLLSLLLSAPAYSQSLGGIARRERERKQNQAAAATHVYDNNDLARPQILLPRDRERVQAAKQKATPTAIAPAVESAGSEPQIDGLPLHAPLGDIARHYRALKTWRQESASQLEPTQPERSAPALAYPKFPLPAARRPTPAAPLAAIAPLHASNPPKGHADKTLRPEEITIAGDSTIRVRAGDTLWELADKYLGRGADWRRLAAENPQVTDPRRLQVGTRLRLPNEAPGLQLHGALHGQHSSQPHRHVRVKLGDSLWKLTQAQFGDGGAWSCVARANSQLRNADLIFPGQILALPESCTPSLAHRRDALAQGHESLERGSSSRSFLGRFAQPDRAVDSLSP